MTERIRQLAKQAGYMRHFEFSETQLEKFAELIVRESISCVGSQADKAYLKKHFGLPVESDIIYPAVEESWSVETQYKKDLDLHFPP